MDLYDEILKQIEAARRELMEQYGIKTEPPKNLKIEKI